jgi:hypothetical protein
LDLHAGAGREFHLVVRRRWDAFFARGSNFF